MKLPARDYVLAGGLACPSADINRPVWQAHVVKHPLGVHGQFHGDAPAPWNLEGWDGTDPPVAPQEVRHKLVKAIGSIWIHGAGCRIPEITNGTPQGTDVERACKACLDRAITECDRLCNQVHPVGARYAVATESLLADVEEGSGEAVTRNAVSAAMMKRLGTPSAFDGLTILTLGAARSDGRTAVARIARADGLVTELYLHNRSLRWRTTHRTAGVGKTINTLLSFLFDMSIPLSSLGALSDVCVVPCHWWGSYGI